MGEVMGEQMGMPFDLLLGRKTYDIFAAYWPRQKGNPISATFSKATKYVVSAKPVELSWENSVLIDSDIVTKIKDLKNSDGPCSKSMAAVISSKRF